MNRVSTGTDNDRDESTQSGDAKYPNERYTLIGGGGKKKSVSREIVRTLSFTHSTKFTIINYYVQKILYPVDRVPFLSRYDRFRDSARHFFLFSSRLTRLIALRGATWIKY